MILLTWLLAACGGGGGGGGDGGGFVDAEPIEVSIQADDTTLPVNPSGAFLPGIGNPFTTTLYVRAELANGSPMPTGTIVQFAITEGLDGSGALYRLDGTDDVDDDGFLVGTRNNSVELASGVATIHFHAGADAGPVRIVATVADPNNGNRAVSAGITIRVGQGNTTSSGNPADIFFAAVDATTLFTQGNGTPDSTRISAVVVDGNGDFVANPPEGVNNLRVELLDQSPGGGEVISGVNAQGNTMRGGVVFLRTINGIATFELISGSTPGTAVFQATIDRADNDVDDGLDNPLRNSASVELVNVLPNTGNPLDIPDDAGQATQELPEGTVGSFYGAFLVAQGGVQPYTWSLEDGSLPPGLNLNANGFLRGVPTQAGNFTFLAQVDDSAGQSEQAIYSVTIVGADGGIGGGGSVIIDDLQLLTSSPQLPTASPDPITLTAVVKDANNNVVPDVAVVFSADNEATLRVTQATTDETGTAIALLTTPGNKANRTITVTAVAANSGVGDEITVGVVGTSISITGQNNAARLAEVPLTISLEDSAGNAIANQELTIQSEYNNPLNGTASPITVETGVNGQVEIIVTAINGEVDPDSNNVIDTITASGLGASSSISLTISTDDFSFVSVPESLPLGEADEVTILWRSFGDEVQGQPVTFFTTRGSISGGDSGNNVDLTDENGEATVTLSASIAGLESTAGPATITATTEGGPSAQTTILFVATDPRKIDLQATPAVLGTNPIGTEGEQSRITAVVRDEDNNPVKGATVTFTLIADVTGGSISPSSGETDDFGRITATYVAGSIPSAEDGVVIQAAVPDQDPTQTGIQPTPATVRLTVARRELFISLGTGNEVEEPSPTRYALPYSVLVTDAAGGPIANSRVTLAVVPTTYDKGRYIFPAGGTKWEQIITTNPSCENEDNRATEDVNGDGILDLNEDLDGDGNFDRQNEDLDGDGELDFGEDIDGDGNLDVDEDIDGDGNFDIGEDTNGNGILDPGEDLDNDGELDINEDLDGDGILDAGEDLDGDGNLDVDEDLDGDGNLDVDEDLDGDGNLDVDEDQNENGILDEGEDLDGDGRLDTIDEDRDGDGRLDTIDEDRDGDGRLDTIDEDVDNDGFLDPDEDKDGDGTLDIGEDRNRNGVLDPAGVPNGILDPGEDLNDNGRLDPGNVATISEATVVTDSNGFAEFEVLYAQENANWVTVDLIARASVSGTEAIEIATFRLTGISDDFTNENVDPPGNPSPFGTSDTCFDDQ